MRKNSILLVLVALLAMAVISFGGLAKAAEDPAPKKQKLELKIIKKEVKTGARMDYIGLRFSHKNYVPAPGQVLYLFLKWKIIGEATTIFERMNPSGEKFVQVTNIEKDEKGTSYLPEIYEGRGASMYEFSLTLAVKEGGENGRVIETSNTEKFIHKFSKF